MNGVYMRSRLIECTEISRRADATRFFKIAIASRLMKTMRNIRRKRPCQITKVNGIQKNEAFASAWAQPYIKVYTDHSTPMLGFEGAGFFVTVDPVLLSVCSHRMLSRRRENKREG